MEGEYVELREKSNLRRLSFAHPPLPEAKSGRYSSDWFIVAGRFQFPSVQPERSGHLPVRSSCEVLRP